MNLEELKEYVDTAIELAVECGYEIKDVQVSMQIELDDFTACDNNPELIFDCDGMASGCVVLGNDGYKA